MVVIQIKNLDRLAQAIRNKRKALAMSQAELAERAGITQSMVAYIESGKSLPSMPNLLTILNELNLVLSVGDQENKHENSEINP